MSAKWLKEYFSFTKKERVGVVTILAILIFVWYLPDLLPKKNEFDAKTFEALQREAIAFLKMDSVGSKNDSVPIARRDKSIERSLFYFDPNTLSAQGWERLGLTEKSIRVIQNYLLHGGSFRKPEDLQKIYGLRRESSEKLMPFVRIKETEKAERPPPNLSYMKAPLPRQSRELSVDINTADTTAWIELPGIGSRLAVRIVGFREKLGGFHSVEQVAETFGLKDSVFQSIRKYLHCDSSGLRKIELNTASLEELKSHPYLRYSLANAIFQYRLQHGNFAKLDELRKIMVITDDIFTKIEPYLTVR